MSPMISAKTKLSPCSEKESPSPIRAVFCLKKKTDMRKIEEVEDCFILDFDPLETLDRSPLSLSKNSRLSDDADADADADVSVLAEKGQVACRDYPHPRHLCVKFPFDKTLHQTHCPMCFCFVCETAAPCKSWTNGVKHCDATENDFYWLTLRRVRSKNPKCGTN